MDFCEACFAAVWPRVGYKYTPYLMLMPAILLVGTLVVGLLYIADSSLRTLDTATFRFSEFWSLENYRRAFSEPFILTVLWRSLVGSVIVTIL
jgi:putative spermidine/putrescine transport system permease protein